MSNLIATDLQKQQVEESSGIAAEIVDLFQLILPDDSSRYFHPGIQDNLGDVQFRDSEAPYTIQNYEPLPMMIGNLDLQADGAANRPVLTIANVTTIFSGELGGFSNKDLLGCRIIRRRTLSKYLADKDPNTKPPVELRRAEYIIDRIKSENHLMVEFECALPFDLESITVPRRQVVGKYCSWMYQGQAKKGVGGCVWPVDSIRKISDLNGTLRTHTPYFNVLDEPLVDASYFNSNQHTGGTWQSVTAYKAGLRDDDNDSYDTASYVTGSDSNLYLCLLDNTNNNPVSTTGFWKKAHKYTDWSVGHSGNYLVGAHVKYSNTIWKCIVEHDPEAAKAPQHASTYWVIAEVCGKKLSSCKCRFQFVPATRNANAQPPAGWKNTARRLPFGAYPGTGRFK